MGREGGWMGVGRKWNVCEVYYHRRRARQARALRRACEEGVTANMSPSALNLLTPFKRAWGSACANQLMAMVY